MYVYIRVCATSIMLRLCSGEIVDRLIYVGVVGARKHFLTLEVNSYDVHCLR